MIGLFFGLSGMLVFMLAVMANDFLILLSSIIRDVEQSFSHDSKIYPDFSPD